MRNRGGGALSRVGLYTATYTRDAASRITVKQEIRPSGTTTWAYNYDAAGRLVNVTKNGDQHAAYTYDANGNRTSKTVENQSTYATFDSRDRMNTQGDLDLTYSQNGELTEKRNRASSESLHLAYTASGDLKSATTPDGRQITYLLDAAGRRVGKKTDGNLTQGLIYSPEAFGPVAELNPDNSLKSRFIYTGAHVRAYMVKNGTTYRMPTDQLGSVVMVVDASSGAVAQELSYGPFGEVLEDSNPGFQPFGFAGGIYDTDTGLTHFGAREYDAGLGRWTASDPIGFNGGDSNLYGYVLGDPVNLVDPSGLVFGLHFDAPSLSEVGTRITGFMDGLTFGGTNLVRERLGIQGGLDKCSDDYRLGKGIGRITGSLMVAIAGGAAYGAAIKLSGAGRAVVVISEGAAGGGIEAVAINGGDVTPSQFVLGMVYGAIGGIAGDFLRGPDAVNTSGGEAAGGSITAFIISGGTGTMPSGCGCAG